MALLRKIKSATLVEAIVATVLVVIIFIVASVILNNILLNNFSKNTHAIEARMAQLQYEAINKAIELPYTEAVNDWEITLKKEPVRDQKKQYYIKALAIKENHEITKSVLCNGNN